MTALEDAVDLFERELGEWDFFEPPLWVTGFRSAPAEDSDETGVSPADSREWGQVNLGTGGSRGCRYLRVGNRLHVLYLFLWGQAPWGAAPGRVATELPPGMLGSALASQYLHAQLWTLSGSQGHADFMGSGLVHPTARQYVQPMFPRSQSQCFLGHYAITGPTETQSDWSVPAIPGGFPEGGSLAIEGVLDIG